MKTLFSFKLRMIFILSSFLVANLVFSKEILSDRFIYKVAGEINSWRDLKRSFEATQYLKCLYPKSILDKTLWPLFSVKNKALFKPHQLKKPSLSLKEKSFFISYSKFSKVITYSKARLPQLKKSVAELLPARLKQLNCYKKSGIELDDELVRELKGLIRLELFLRLRFLPEQEKGKASRADFDKAVTSAKNFVGLNSKQISSEFFW